MLSMVVMSPDKSSTRNAMPFVFILGLPSIVGFFAGARAFLDGEDFEAGKVVRKSVRVCRNMNIQVCVCVRVMCITVLSYRFF